MSTTTETTPVSEDVLAGENDPKQMRLIKPDPNEVLGRLRKKYRLLVLQKAELEIRKQSFGEQRKLVETLQAEHDEIVAELLDGTVSATPVRLPIVSAQAAPAAPEEQAVDEDDSEDGGEEADLAREMRSRADTGHEEEEAPRFTGVRSRPAYGNGPE